jgi:hypothetical protein
MTTAEDDPDREHESQAEVPAPADETPAPLRKAAAGVAEAQAWKGPADRKGLAQARERTTQTGGGRGVDSSAGPGATADDPMQYTFQAGHAGRVSILHSAVLPTNNGTDSG